MLPHSVQEWKDIVDGGRVHKLAVVKYQTNPEVVHEDGEPSHDGDDTPRPSELISVQQPMFLIMKPAQDRLTRTAHVCRAAGPFLYLRQSG